MPHNRLIYLLMVLVAFFWGGTFNAAGFALAAFHPLTIAFLRFAIATAVLLLLGHHEIFSTTIKTGDWLHFILLGSLEFLLTMLFSSMPCAILHPLTER